jgi:hypothetical protein
MYMYFLGSSLFRVMLQYRHAFPVVSYSCLNTYNSKHTPLFDWAVAVLWVGVRESRDGRS